MSIASPILLAISVVLVAATIMVVRLRRVHLPPSAAASLLVGMICLALAAAGLSIRWPEPREALILIDLSPSTRTAAYRNPAVRERRIKELLGPVRYTVQTFGDSEPIGRTVLPLRTNAHAIVLFSDAQFDPITSAVPVYPVIDPNLQNPPDASIEQLEVHGEQVAVTVSNPGEPREIAFGGARGPTTVPAGNPVVFASIDPNATAITARLGGGDPWPENDSLSIRRPLRRQNEQWWIDAGSRPAGYRPFTPSQLPTDSGEYLQASAIVLNNVPATSLSPIQQQRLMQFVRDLGGGLVLLGGDQSFAAGGYLGTLLESLSPLASTPGMPQRQWIILADSSGSMAAPVDGSTRWQRAASAITQLLAALPPSDPVSIGNFSREVRWWSQARSAAETAKLPLPPPDITPSGPTNIQPILTALASQLRPNVTTEIILISDADAAIDDPLALAGMLQPLRASVNLLLTGDNPRAPLIQVVALTSGNMIPQKDPTLWAQDAVKLARSTLRDFIERRPTQITFTDSLERLAPRVIPLWNRTWIKDGATEFVRTTENNATIAMAAKWKYGAGHVAAAAFAPTAAEADALVSLASQPPRDPRFTVAHSGDEFLTIHITAIDGGQYMNDLNLTLAMTAGADAAQRPTLSPFNQTAPGQYELTITAPRTPMLAAIRLADQIIDRFAIAARYAPEFDRIGNNRMTMQQIANQSGGAIIELAQTTPIDFHWPARFVSLSSPLSISGTVFILLGLILWKLL